MGLASILTSHWAASVWGPARSPSQVLSLPDKTMGTGCLLAAPSSAETDNGPALSFAVNLWKIYKAVEKLGAYEMVRKEPESALCCIPPYVPTVPGDAAEKGEPSNMSLPPDRRKGRGLSCRSYFAARSKFSSLPHLFFRTRAGKAAWAAVRSPRGGRTGWPPDNPLQPPLPHCWRSSCKTAIPAEPGLSQDPAARGHALTWCPCR